VPEDPARVAVRLMLARALDAAGVPVSEAAADGAVCLVRVPSAEWVGVVRDVWRDWARGGERWTDGAARGYSALDELWDAWAPREEPRRHDRDTSAEVLSQSIAAGRHCAGIAAEADWPPTDLVRAADHRLSVAALTGADVAELARRMCGGAGTSEAPPDDGEAAALTPRLLRLARRPGQTADACLRKLRGVLAQERAAARTAAAAAASTSPRDAPTLDRLRGLEEAVAAGKEKQFILSRPGSRRGPRRKGPRPARSGP
jgi:hypothetical protein